MEKEIILNEDDDDGPSIGSIDFDIFTAEVEVLVGFKRALLKKKLKKEKMKLLCEVMEINKKLKLLDELDKKADKERNDL